MQATESGFPSIQNRKLVVLVAARLRHGTSLIICRDECLLWTCQRALCLPCLLLENEEENEDGVPIGPQRRRRGAWQMRRVLLVEDHAAFRQALTDVLNMQPDLEVVGRAGSLAQGRTAAAALVEEVDVAVVDVFLPDGNGVELVRELRRADPGLSIVILTAGVDPKLHALAFEAGADEVCVKAEGIEEIMRAIRGVAADR